ncbi:MAG: N-acetylmuramoyl-L-alanine amidase [Candidatus Electronema sp. V4]|uniref:N-acetylmuramoyl-L-alanine amidase n=1 Tax=Candidatus Electronema sp. V4 TaxID=3454756 RepID=UPI0040557ADD
MLPSFFPRRFVLPIVAACLCLLLPSARPASSATAAAAENAAKAEGTEADYQKAADQCHRLLQNPAGGTRVDWLKAAESVELIYRKNPQSRTAPASLHLSARMRQAMHQRFRQPADLDQAVARYSNVVSLHPNSHEAAESLYALAQIEQQHGNLRGAAKTYYKLVHSYPLSSRRTQAQEQLRQLTVIAESLTARKEGKRAAAVFRQMNPPFEPEKKPQEKTILPQPVPPPRQTVTFTPTPPKPASAPPAQKIAPAPNQPPVVSVPAQEKIVLALPVALPPKPAVPALLLPKPAVPAAKAPEKTPKPVVPLPSKPADTPKKEEEAKRSLLAELSFPDWDFPFFSGSEEKKPEPEKNAVKTPPAAEPPKPAPPVIVTLPEPPKPLPAVVPAPPPAAAEQQADQSKIFVSELKIAALEPEPSKPAPAAAPPSPEPAAPPPALPKPPEQPALTDLLPIQHWSSDRYSRVAVSASGMTDYEAQLPDKPGGQPGQLRLKFKRSHVPPELREPLVFDAGPIKSIHAGQADAETAEVVLELDSAADCKVFSLNDPFRVVVDVRRLEQGAQTADAAKELTEQEKEARAAAVREKLKVRPKGAEQRSLTLAQQLGLGIRRIMIDPGHGGKDSGAVGFGLREKDIVLDVARRVRSLLKKDGYEVLTTRDKDVFIPLEERTALANTKGADLFLSVHVNAHPKPWVKGVETFYLNLAANPEAMRVAALENATSSRSMSEMESILASLMKNTKIDESSLLAEFIQTSMADGLNSYKTKNLGVKKAPFYVLIGAQMPAALAEISFISNKEEAELLKDDKYLQAIAERIAAGVTAYIEHRQEKATAALNKQLP